MGFRTIRWGIIGCGNVCEVKSGPGFQKAEHSALVAVMRRDAAKARDFAERHGVPKWYADAGALIADPEVDAVYVATPPDGHARYAIEAAKAGKPVYVEKPMARDYAECRIMIDACRDAGVPLFVAYYRRRLPRFLKVKEILDQGGIGKVRTVSVTLVRPTGPEYLRPEAPPWLVVPGIAGGGLFLDLASHTLDVLDFLLGPIAEAKGLAANQSGLHRAEDAVAAAFAFESGTLGAGSWSFSAHAHEDRIEIDGSEGRLVFGTFGDEPIRWISAAGTREIPTEIPAHIQQPLIQSIVWELNGVGSCPSTGESAARTNRVMDAILKDFRAR
jgi:predicted dehydrogenase